MQSPDMETVIDSNQRFQISIKKIWAFRELFLFFTLRDIKLRYHFLPIAVFWVTFPPFLLSLVFSISLGRAILGSPSHLPYVIFAFTGLIFWNLFSDSVNRSAGSLAKNKALFTKVSFPKIIIPISSAAISFVDFFMGFIFLQILLFFFGTSINYEQIFLIIPALIIIFLFSVGIGLFFGTLSVKYKDTKEILPLCLSILFFLTPVIYPVRLVTPAFHSLLYLNPLAWIIETMRFSFFSSTPVNWLGFWISLFIAVAFFCIGFAYFIYTEKELVDIL